MKVFVVSQGLVQVEEKQEQIPTCEKSDRQHRQLSKTHVKRDCMLNNTLFASASLSAKRFIILIQP